MFLLHLSHRTLSFHVHLSQLHKYCYMYTIHRYFIILYIVTVTWILNTAISCASIIVRQTLLFHVLVSSLHEHSSTLDTAISCRHWLHWTLLFHVSVSLITLIHYTCTSGTCIFVTRVLYTIITCTCYMDSLVYML